MSGQARFLIFCVPFLVVIIGILAWMLFKGMKYLKGEGETDGKELLSKVEKAWMVIMALLCIDFILVTRIGGKMTLLSYLLGVLLVLVLGFTGYMWHRVLSMKDGDSDG